MIFILFFFFFVTQKVESPNSSSTELWKDEISKEIEELKQQLHKKQAVFAALVSFCFLFPIKVTVFLPIS